MACLLKEDPPLNYSAKPKNIKPFSKVKLFRGKYFRLLKDFNFYTLPKSISFQTDFNLIRQPFFVAIFIFSVSGLLVSRLPTYSFKSLRIQHRFILLTMLVVGLIAALAATAPWLTLTIILILYIISFPFGLQSYRKQEAKAIQTPDIPDSTDNS